MPHDACIPRTYIYVHSSLIQRCKCLNFDFGHGVVCLLFSFIHLIGRVLETFLIFSKKYSEGFVLTSNFFFPSPVSKFNRTFDYVYYICIHTVAAV